MVRLCNIFIVLGLVLATLLGGCKPKVRTVTGTGTLLLLEARFERTHSGGTETVSKIRFIAGSGVSTSVFLPCGQEWGIGIAFVPEVPEEGQVVLAMAAHMERFYAEDILGEYKDWPSLYGEGSGGGYRSFRANTGEDIMFLEGSRGLNNVKVSYKVFVNCHRTVDYSSLEHVESSLYVLDGERLHLTNVAIPQIMTGGVELGDMIDKKANTE